MIMIDNIKKVNKKHKIFQLNQSELSNKNPAWENSQTNNIVKIIMDNKNLFIIFKNNK